jgi:3'(2'), 5'-bisphosphate nucleotidase
MSEEQLLDLAIGAARKAGEAIMEVYAKPFRVVYKSDSSPVTQADRRASRIIVEALQPSGITVISEEEAIPSYAQRRELDRLWLVDPLDGTKEFVKRNGEFSVNIGLVQGGYPVLGVIYMPVLNELYFASVATGSIKVSHEQLLHLPPASFRLENLLKCGRKLPMGGPAKYTVVASRSHLSSETYAHLKKRKLEHGETDVIYSGSSVKMCWVAEGRAHEYPRYGRTMEWDTAAGQAIVENAGGRFINLQTGERLHYNKSGLDNPDFLAIREPKTTP